MNSKSVVVARYELRVVSGKLETRDSELVTGVVKNAQPEKSKISKTAKRQDEGRFPQGI